MSLALHDKNHLSLHIVISLLKLFLSKFGIGIDIDFDIEEGFVE
jgi:hypothetical protein